MAKQRHKRSEHRISGITSDHVFRIAPTFLPILMVLLFAFHHSSDIIPVSAECRDKKYIFQP